MDHADPSLKHDGRLGILDSRPVTFWPEKGLHSSPDFQLPSCRPSGSNLDGPEGVATGKSAWFRPTSEVARDLGGIAEAGRVSARG